MRWMDWIIQTVWDYTDARAEETAGGIEDRIPDIPQDQPPAKEAE